MPAVDQVPIVGPFVPNLVGAVVILIVGWLVALLIARAVAAAHTLAFRDRLDSVRVWCGFRLIHARRRASSLPTRRV